MSSWNGGSWQSCPILPTLLVLQFGAVWLFAHPSSNGNSFSGSPLAPSLLPAGPWPPGCFCLWNNRDEWQERFLTTSRWRARCSEYKPASPCNDQLSRAACGGEKKTETTSGSIPYGNSGTRGTAAASWQGEINKAAVPAAAGQGWGCGECWDGGIHCICGVLSVSS